MDTGYNFPSTPDEQILNQGRLEFNRGTEMSWHYEYTPYIWPMLAAAVFMAALGVYGWRRRTVPGALPFSLLMLFWSLLALGATLELAAVAIATKVFWLKFQFFWQGPIAVAGLCFVLAYARLDRFLTRRTLLPLSFLLITGSILILTNSRHHWIWIGFTFDGEPQPLRGNAYWILISFGYLLAWLNLPILIWLSIRSPLHRWPVAFVLGGQLVVRAAFLLEAANVNPVAPMNPFVLAVNFLAVVYALALFGFHMLDPIPMARETAITQMKEGMLVLDTDGKIVALNPAAANMLGAPTQRLRGMAARQVLPAYAAIGGGAAWAEISLDRGGKAGCYTLHRSTLKDWRGQTFGFLLLLHDVTEQKQTQARIMEQQRALAALQERERVGRELHDGLGQVLGYVKMQTQAARDRLAHGQTAAAEADLAHLAAIAQEAHADVREYILGTRPGIASDGFLPALRQYLRRFDEYYGIRTELIAPPDLTDDPFTPTVAAQVLRIIQEALTNARKHARAHCIQVHFCLEDGRVRVIVQDDGAGFDPALLPAGEGQTYGLRFMRERAVEVGGNVEFHSAPGAGTQVIIDVPRQRRKYESAAGRRPPAFSGWAEEPLGCSLRASGGYGPRRPGSVGEGTAPASRSNPNGYPDAGV